VPGPRSRTCSRVETIPADAEWGGESLALEPVDEVSVLTVCDNTVDILLVDQGPAKRLPLAGALTGAGVPRLAAPSLNEGNVVDARLAEHGFSTLVEVRKGGAVHRLLFDTGLTPTGCIDNLRRLGHDPGDIEAIVCSHGHFDHTTGLSGLIDQLGRTNLPVLIHPEFWTHRRLAIPGVDRSNCPRRAVELSKTQGSTSSRTQRPSFLFERSVLITGEVDRTTSFERDTGSRRDRPVPLHRREGRPLHRPAVPRCLHPEQRRYHLQLTADAA
jgi:7,8-dihydropterin-6-yl-methyl-4-(beta-D-ribofuranosyl)aminobenzene 5'-phosphate synthase